MVQEQPRLLRLAQVALMLQVHPKTVYYWVRTGRLKALSSPGGLLRVRAEDARTLCQNAGMPVPADLATVRRRVHLIEGDKLASRATVRALKAKGFEVRAFDDAYEALVATAREPPEALVVDAPAPGFDARRAHAALQRDDATKRTRVLVWGDTFADDPELEGVEAVAPRGDTGALLKALR